MKAQAPEELEEITAISSATVINTGTPDREKFTACGLSVGSAAKSRPVALAPVGAGVFRSALMDAASAPEPGEFARLTRAEML